MFDFWKKRTQPSFENPNTGLANPAAWLVSTLGGGFTSSGVTVSEEGAQKLIVVNACIQIISESIASLPVQVYKRTSTGKDLAADHAVYEIVHDTPNREMTAVNFYSVLAGHVLAWGNAYAYIARAPGGRITELVPLLPDRTHAYRVGGKLGYVTRINDQDIPLQPHEVLHIPGFSFDGVQGQSPLRKHAEAIGLALAAEKLGGKFFGNGANLGSVITHPRAVSAQTAQNIRDSLKQYTGIDNSAKTMILEEGMKYERIGIPPNEAQFLETREFQKKDIATIFRVPLHFLGDLSRATFSNIEHQDINFVRHTIRPWIVRFEQELNRKLFAENDRKKHFVQWNLEGLLRGDTKSRYEAYHMAIADGWMNRNEARARENLNPQEGLDEFLQPLNMAPAGQVAEPEQEQQEDYTTTRTLIDALRPIIASTEARLQTCERQALEKELKRADSLPDFASAFAAFAEKHAQFCQRLALPICQTIAPCDAEKMASEYAQQRIATLLSEIKSATSLAAVTLPTLDKSGFYKEANRYGY